MEKDKYDAAADNMNNLAGEFFGRTDYANKIFFVEEEIHNQR